MTKKIAVIGAGATGMASVKACLEQGLNPVVFEKTNYTGGLWRYKETVDENGTASVMKSTIINSSKEMSAFSDFPPPPEYPNYMHNTKMVAYFDMYAERFNFNKYVKLRHELVRLEMADDYEETGRWKVTVKDLDKNVEHTDVFDGVMICTGHHGTVSMPKFKGQEKFKGRIMHTHSLKHSKGFEDQNVVVVGVGNSGVDAAVELSYVAKQIYLSTRSGTWVFQRVGSQGQPFDQYFHRRFLRWLFSLVPYSWSCSFMEFQLNSVFNHDDYNLRPKHRCMSQHITVNDSLPNRILSGTVKVKSDIDYFTENGVIFKGENQETQCDTVILATGYKVHFPFLSETILPVNRNRVRLYKFQFIPHLKHPETLAFLALSQPIGALVPIGELQARWFSLLMAKKLRLPSRQVMEKDIDMKDEAMRNRYYDSERHTIQVDWLPFMDELAKEVGCLPSLWKYLFTDFKLFLALIFQASAPYCYRLTGPNSWDGAREAYLTVQDRIKAPLETNKLTPIDSEKGFKISRFGNLFYLAPVLSVIILVILVLSLIYRTFF